MNTTSQPSNPALQLCRDTYYQVVHTLRGSLPPPVTDTPEDLARRDNAAIAHVASLLPANADEAHLASQHVAADAYAMDHGGSCVLPEMQRLGRQHDAPGALGEGAAAARAGRAPRA
jgi:hypothetical protein